MDETPLAATVVAASALSDEWRPGLRDTVLAGRFFGPAAGDAPAALAAFLHGDRNATPLSSLTAWFGDRTPALLADRDALRAALDRDIAALDRLIGAQLDQLLHAHRLRRFEGSWRGLQWLVSGIDPSSRVKVRLLSCTWSEICRDLERAAEFDQSNLFRRIYEDEFGSPGGEPYGLLMIDHEVRHRPAAGAPTDDVAALAALASVAAAAFVPTVLSASPALLDLENFAALATVSDPAAALKDADHARWRNIASRDDLRFLCVTLPRVLARPPWSDSPGRNDRFRYAEYAPDPDDRIWMSAGYAFAAVVARSFEQTAWPADVRGVEEDRIGGGLVDELPIEPFATDPDGVWIRPPLEVILTDRQERLLVDAGLMPLSALPATGEALFGAVRSLQVPDRFTGPTAAVANANARLSTQINAMLCVSRFAHYLKLLGRQMIGSFRTAEEIQRELQRWLLEYVNSNISPDPRTAARYPLVSGRVTVSERPGRPGVFGCVIHLQPHFQLDDVSATFRLVTDIAAPGAT